MLYIHNLQYLRLLHQEPPLHGFFKNQNSAESSLFRLSIRHRKGRPSIGINTRYLLDVNSLDAGKMGTLVPSGRPAFPSCSLPGDVRPCDATEKETSAGSGMNAVQLSARVEFGIDIRVLQACRKQGTENRKQKTGNLNRRTARFEPDKRSLILSKNKLNDEHERSLITSETTRPNLSNRQKRRLRL